MFIGILAAFSEIQIVAYVLLVSCALRVLTRTIIFWELVRIVPTLSRMTLRI